MPVSTLIQYIFVRNDLAGYPSGALMAQAVHAGVLALSDREDPAVAAYLAQKEHMHTVVLQCTKEELEELCGYFEAHSVKHAPWREFPENEITAVGMTPLTKSSEVVQKKIRKYKLWGR